MVDLPSIQNNSFLPPGHGSTAYIWTPKVGKLMAQSTLKKSPRKAIIPHTFGVQVYKYVYVGSRGRVAGLGSPNPKPLGLGNPKP